MNDVELHTWDGETCRVCGLDAVDVQVCRDAGAEPWPCVPTSPRETRVVNRARYRFDVVINRPSIWGNPFVIGPDGDRNTVVAKYETWLMTQPALLAKLPELRGKVLGCWCQEASGCHGSVLARLADMPTEVLDPTLIIIDTETTGVSPAAQVIELAIQFGLGMDAPPAVRVWRFKPTIPIEAGATAAHGMTNVVLQECPAFAVHAEEIHDFIARADVIIGYNVAFDIEKLSSEFVRCQSVMPDLSAKQIIDPLQLWRVSERRTLMDAHKRFVGGTFDGAHNAAADVAATGAVLLGMLEQFGHAGKFWDEIAGVCDPDRPTWLGNSGHFVWRDGNVVLTFGKHKGARICSPAVSSYLRWLRDKDFPAHVREVAHAVLVARTEAEFLQWAQSKYPARGMDATLPDEGSP